MTKLSTPTTTLTDYLLAILTFIWAALLFDEAQQEQQISQGLWAAGFLMTGAAAALGGTWHGFEHTLQEKTKKLIWRATTYSLGLSGFCFVSAIVIATLSAPLKLVVIILVFAKLIFYLWWMWTHTDFRYVVLDQAPSMILVILLQAYAAYQFQSDSAGWIISGVVIAFIGSGVQQSGVRLHKHFNYNDIYHLFQIVTFYFLYRGGMLLVDR